MLPKLKFKFFLLSVCFKFQVKVLIMQNHTIQNNFMIYLIVIIVAYMFHHFNVTADKGGGNFCLFFIGKG